MMRDIVKDIKHSIDSDIDDTTSVNFMRSVDMVMIIWDRINERTKRTRNVSIVVRNILLKHGIDFKTGYIRTIRSLGMRLRKYGFYKRALLEDWSYRTTINELAIAEKNMKSEKKLIMI